MAGSIVGREDPAQKIVLINPQIIRSEGKQKVRRAA